MSPEELPPRISPGGRREAGPLNWLILTIGSRRLGSGPVPNLFLTLARHRSLFRPWLWFSSRLMPYGTLPAVDAELIILRVAARCNSRYERAHHTALGKAAGLGRDMIAWSEEPVGSPAAPPEDDGIAPARATLVVEAADELLDTHDLGDATWARLEAVYDETQLIEFCMLVGQYAMLAGTLNALRVPLDGNTGLHKLR